jgi:hypothetical protein
VVSRAALSSERAGGGGAVSSAVGVSGNGARCFGILAASNCFFSVGLISAGDEVLDL